jgi:PPOX class probable F420-dependent enzyme
MEVSVMPAITTTTTLAKESFISVTTFKRDRTAVATPVWWAGKNGSLLAYSEADSGKVKRIRHDPHVTVAPCSFRGTPRGPAAEADATLAGDTDEVEALLARKYGWMWRGYNLLMAAARGLRRQARPDAVTITITLR